MSNGESNAPLAVAVAAYEYDGRRGHGPCVRWHWPFPPHPKRFCYSQAQHKLEPIRSSHNAHSTYAGRVRTDSSCAAHARTAGPGVLALPTATILPSRHKCDALIRAPASSLCRGCSALCSARACSASASPPYPASTAGEAAGASAAPSFAPAASAPATGVEGDSASPAKGLFWRERAE